jgi:hypothetical protein
MQIRSERKTQNRVVTFFAGRQPDSLGYQYLGEGSKRNTNRNIDRTLLETNLGKRGYKPEQISAPSRSSMIPQVNSRSMFVWYRLNPL